MPDKLLPCPDAVIWACGISEATTATSCSCTWQSQAHRQGDKGTWVLLALLPSSFSDDSSAGTWCARARLSCGTGLPASSRLRWVQAGHAFRLDWAGRGLAGQPGMTPPSLPCPCAQHDDLRPVIMRRRSSSDLAKQKFGTMPLVPLHGDSTDATMLSANQTLVKPLQIPPLMGAPAPSQVHAPILRPCACPRAPVQVLAA